MTTCPNYPCATLEDTVSPDLPAWVYQDLAGKVCQECGSTTDWLSQSEGAENIEHERSRSPIS